MALKLLLIVAAALLAGGLVSATTTSCGYNEEYKCGSDCGRSCSDLGRRVLCPRSCSYGCFCLRGYLRDPDQSNACVRPLHCHSMAYYYKPQAKSYPVHPKYPKYRAMETQPRCASGQVWTDCGNRCELHCQDLDRTYEADKRVCRDCYAGCQCWPGYYRNWEGQCVTEKHCPRPSHLKMITKNQQVWQKFKHFFTMGG